MSFASVLGDIGYGVPEALNTWNKVYEGTDKARMSDITANRAESQYTADQDYDIFNAGAAQTRAGLDAGAGVHELALDKTNLARASVADQAVMYSPETRAALGALAQEHGSSDTPEYQRAVGDYLAQRGLLSQAGTFYDTARKQDNADKIVLSKIQNQKGFEGVHGLGRDEDGNLVALIGEADADDMYDSVVIPSNLVALHQALMGDQRARNSMIDDKAQDLRNQAAAAGQFGQQKTATTTKAAANTNGQGVAKPQFTVAQVGREAVRLSKENGLPVEQNYNSAVENLNKSVAVMRGDQATVQQPTQQRQSIASQAAGIPTSPVGTYPNSNGMYTAPRLNVPAPNAAQAASYADARDLRPTADAFAAEAYGSQFAAQQGQRAQLYAPQLRALTDAYEHLKATGIDYSPAAVSAQTQIAQRQAQLKSIQAQITAINRKIISG